MKENNVRTNMSYLYCLDINIKTRDDVNTMFRDAQLKGEITMTPDGKIFYVLS